MGKSVSKVLKYKGEVLLREFPEKFGKILNKQKIIFNGTWFIKNNKKYCCWLHCRLAKRKEKNN